MQAMKTTGYSDSERGRNRAWLARLVNQALDTRDFGKAVSVCRHAETLFGATADDFRAVRVTLQAVGLVA